MDSFDNKREYGLSEIGKRGFTSTLGYDYSTAGSPSEFGIGATSVVGSDYNNGRSGGSSGEVLSPARDLIPPPAPASYASSTSPPTSISDYSKYSRLSSSPSSSGKDFHSPHRTSITRRSPHIQPASLSRYFDDITSGSVSPLTSRARVISSGNYGLVTDNDGKLIGYHGSVLPGYSETQPIVTSTVSDPNSFIGSYYPGSSGMTEYSKPKFSLASSGSSGSYSSTPIYYPGREEDHTYRIRDSTSQGYDDDDRKTSSEDNDFPFGGNTYQPSPLPPPPTAQHYHLRESDGKQTFDYVVVKKDPL